MNTQVDVQVRLWPWSTGNNKDEIFNLSEDRLDFPYYGSPVLVVAENVRLTLPKRGEQFITFGVTFPTLRGNYQLYEMPHGVITSKVKQQACSTMSQVMFSSHNQIKYFDVNTMHALSPLENDTMSHLAQTVTSWSQFFDDCIDKCQKEDKQNSLPWQTFLEYLQEVSGDMSEPRMALIVHIAEKMRKRLTATVQAARKVLFRQRSLLPIERITETDTACLRWYIRQPGENTAQKAAAHRQKLMGIARKESFDTLENRVLKDFIYRCKNTAQKYISTEVKDIFLNSSRAKSIRHFQKICSELLFDASIIQVSALRSRVTPNYVLQNDPRYKEVWKNYIRLLRQEDEEDRSWDWQSRTWADIVRVLTGTALHYVEHMQPLLHASMQISHEQRLGSRTVSGSEPGPFIVYESKNCHKAQWMLEIIHCEDAHTHKATSMLSRTGAHLYLLLERIGSNEKRILVIWGVHTAASDFSMDWENMSTSAHRALQSHEAILSEYHTSFPKLSGLVLASSLSLKAAQLESVAGVPVITLPTDPRLWIKQIEDLAYLLQICIEEVLQ